MKNKVIGFIGLCMVLALVGCGDTKGEKESSPALSETGDTEPQTAGTQKSETQTEPESETASGAEDAAGVENKDFYADVNHDGKDEKVVVTADSTDASMPTVVTVAVFSDDNELFKEEVPVTMALAYQCYMTEYDGKDYLLNYYPLVDHDMATCRFEVFSINGNGEKETIDSGNVEASLLSPEKLDKEAWLAFAEKENQYFEHAYLLVSTTDGIVFGDSSEKKSYAETFAWINLGLQETFDTAEENLQFFMEQESDLDSE